MTPTARDLEEAKNLYWDIQNECLEKRGIERILAALARRTRETRERIQSAVEDLQEEARTKQYTQSWKDALDRVEEAIRAQSQEEGK